MTFVAGMMILKVLLKFSCMVLQMLVYQVTVAAYISGIVTIIIATTHPLFFSQSRIAPIKSQTIPHLELRAILLLAKSMKNIYKGLITIIPMNLLCYWSDSTIALSWVKNTSKKYELYIDCCVSEIRKLSNPLNWHHIISGSTPADILSRRCLISELSKLNFLFCGPKFLCTKFLFDNVGQNSCFVDHADRSSQFCLLAQGEE